MTSGPARPTAHDLGQAPGAALAGSAARALRVLGLVLDHGPVTPARLTALSGLGRTAVHRAIHALMDQGFIRYQLGKTHVIVTAGLRARLEGAFFSPAGIDAISAAVEAALKHRRLQCDIAVLPPEGPARIVETTAPDPDLEIDFFGSDLASVLLSHFTPVEVTRLTARVLRETGGESSVERDFLDRYRQAQYQGFLWNAAQNSFCVRLLAEGDQAVAIRLFSRGTARLRKGDCVETMRAMGRELPRMFPKIAAIND